MTLKDLRLFVDDSLESDDLTERRVAICVDRMMAMREAIGLEAALKDDPISAALLLSGEAAMEACLDIMGMFWSQREG